jgi:hypothetical protein
MIEIRRRQPTFEEIAEMASLQYREDLRRKEVAGSTYDLLTDLLRARGNPISHEVPVFIVGEKTRMVKGETTYEFPDRDIPFVDSDRRTTYKIKILPIMGDQTLSALPVGFEIKYQEEGEWRYTHPLFTVRRWEIKGPGRQKIDNIKDLKMAKRIIRRIINSAYKTFPLPLNPHSL